MAAEAPPRVLMTTDTVGGVWTYALELAFALDAHGVELALATMGAPLSPHQREQLADLPRVKVFESHWRLEWMQDPWDDVATAADWLLALEREFQPGLVHLNQYAFGALPFRAPKLVVGHSCVLSWWRAVHDEDAPPEWNTYHHHVAAGLAGADLVVAPTRAMLDALVCHYGEGRDGLVIGNAADPGQFRPLPKKDFVLAAGRFWDEAKNLAALDEAAHGLAWPVRVAGSLQHPQGGTVRPVAAQALGELPRGQLAGELARAAIFAAPARYEPFGLSILEAALAGCALVLGDIPSLRETWGDAALYVPPAHPDALRAALAGLIARPAARAHLAQAARERALAFSVARQRDAYLAAYGRLQPRFAPRPSEELPCTWSSSAIPSSPTGTMAMRTSCAVSAATCSRAATAWTSTSRTTPGA